MTAKVIGVATDSNEDGSHSILIEHEGKQVPVVIPIQHLQDLIGQFQVSAIHKAHESVESIRIPELSVTRIDIAHKGPSCELMVSTTQTGTVVLLMNDDQVRKMRAEVDRVLSHRGDSIARN
jgi:CBS-domain-containing membrane protein